MSFENFDKKIKEAADHHHPAYDEQAWTKMEKLLNKHLPQKEDDRRRFLFIILLFLGLGGGALFVFKPWRKTNSTTIAANQNQQDNTSDKSPVTEPTVKSDPSIAGKEERSPNKKRDSKFLMPGDEANSVHVTDRSTNPPVIAINGKPVASEPFGETVRNGKNPVRIIDGQKTSKIRTAKQKPVKPAGDADPVLTVNGVVISKDKTENISLPVSNAVDAVITENINQDKPVRTSDPVNNVTPVTSQPVSIADKKDVVTEESPVAADKKAKERKKKQSEFFFSLSAGPDLSYVNNNKAGDVKLLAGLGIGYTYKERLTIRTGFYSARKVYTATANAYDPPAGFYSLYPYLEKVEADCKVYEIPVSLSYNFKKKKEGNFFVSAGLSTFLMNEETYNYHYKYTPTGNTYTNKWTVKNENSHFFSVATISGGYKKDIGKRFMMMAEPYIKLPLGGVGYGKVKLNSGGVLFTIGVKPF